MRFLHPYVGAAVLLLAGLCAAQARDTKVLVPGDPPLTQDMADDYAKYLEWRLGAALAPAGAATPLAPLIVNDWKNGDVKRRNTMLAALKWWREDFPNLTKDEREQLAAANTKMTRDLARQRQASHTQAIHMLMLQQAFDARQLEILAISNIRAKGHEVNMQIINNLRPSGRYEYNPATGRYDRYVPNR